MLKPHFAYLRNYRGVRFSVRPARFSERPTVWICRPWGLAWSPPENKNESLEREIFLFRLYKADT